jgi:hypothetical protein
MCLHVFDADSIASSIPDTRLAICGPGLQVLAHFQVSLDSGLTDYQVQQVSIAASHPAGAGSR